MKFGGESFGRDFKVIFRTSFQPLDKRFMKVCVKGFAASQLEAGAVSFLGFWVRRLP